MLSVQKVYIIEFNNVQLTGKKCPLRMDTNNKRIWPRCRLYPNRDVDLDHTIQEKS